MENVSSNYTKAQGKQKSLQKKADLMRQRLDGAAKGQEGNSKCLSRIRQYVDIKELGRKMLHLPIKKAVAIRWHLLLRR